MIAAATENKIFTKIFFNTKANAFQAKGCSKGKAENKIAGFAPCDPLIFRCVINRYAAA
jgi:hypothetical protein